jgi:hypothetical protein
MPDQAFSIPNITASMSQRVCDSLSCTSAQCTPSRTDTPGPGYHSLGTLTLPSAPCADGALWFPRRLQWSGSGTGSLGGNALWNCGPLNASVPCDMSTGGFQVQFELRRHSPPPTGPSTFNVLASQVNKSQSVTLTLTDQTGAHPVSITRTLPASLTSGDESSWAMTFDMDISTSQGLPPDTYDIYYSTGSLGGPGYRAPFFVPGCAQFDTAGSTTISGIALTLHCDDPVGPPPPPEPVAGPDIAADMIDNTIAVAWTQGDGSLYVSSTRKPEKTIGTLGDASVFDPALKIGATAKQRIAAAFLPNRTLLVLGQDPITPFLWQNKKHGSGTTSDWTKLSTGSSFGRSVCRAQEALITFIGGGSFMSDGTPYYYGFPGCARCWDNKGYVFGQASVPVLTWTSYVGGAWLGNRYGLLYSEGGLGVTTYKIKWVTSPDVRHWEHATPTDTGQTGQVADLVRTKSGVLVALVWDWLYNFTSLVFEGTRQCKAMRSRDSGKTWEMDTDPIDVIPALLIPPKLVCEQAIVYAVWIDNHMVEDGTENQPYMVASVDGGNTWK